MDAADVALLRESARTHTILKLTVSGCAYSCCGRGWRRRDYEAEYVGYVSDLKDDGIHLVDQGDGSQVLEEEIGRPPATFMLVSPGLGTVSYTLAVRDWEVELVERR